MDRLSLQSEAGHIPSRWEKIRQALAEYGELYGGRSLRATLAEFLLKTSQLSLAITLVLIPVRFRIVLQARPVPPIYKDFTDLLLFISDIFLLASLSLWVLALLLKPRRIQTGPVFLSGPMLGLTLAVFASGLTSIDRTLSIYHGIRLVVLAGFYLVLLNIPNLKKLVVPALAVQIYLQGAVGLLQNIQQHSIGLEKLGELELDPAWRGVSIVWAEGVRSLRAYGLSDHPNILGGCLAFGLLYLSVRLLRMQPRWQIPAALAFSVGLIGLFLTYSRAAWLAFGSGSILIALGFIKNRAARRGEIWKWMALMGGAALLLLPFVWQNRVYLGVRLNQAGSFRSVPVEQQSLFQREALNQAANQIFASASLTGIGAGNFPLALRQLEPDLKFDYQPAHVALLDVAAETGLFGATFYFLAMVAPWLALLVNRHRLTFTSDLLAASAVLLGLTVVGLFDYYTWHLVPGRLWQYLGWGLWATAYRRSLIPPPPDRKGQTFS